MQLIISKKINENSELTNRICILSKLPSKSLDTIAVVDHNKTEIMAQMYSFFIVFLLYTFKVFFLNP